jgi:hypothetical protein
MEGVGAVDYHVRDFPLRPVQRTDADADGNRVGIDDHGDVEEDYSAVRSSWRRGLGRVFPGFR